MREWCPNFHPNNQPIEFVAIQVRFFGLPIHYYDGNILCALGNHIRRTVRVDRSTWTNEKGKYTKLCVEVDLTKPLLALFKINQRYYKIEYKGLHFLCLGCGRFGHYVEGCPDKGKETWNGNQNTVVNRAQVEKEGRVSTSKANGPWAAVKKCRDLGEEKKKRRIRMEEGMRIPT